MPIITNFWRLLAAVSFRTCGDSRDIYADTLIHYEDATGTLLDRHNIALSDALMGMFSGPVRQRQELAEYASIKQGRPNPDCAHALLFLRN